MAKKKQKWRIGDVFLVPMSDGTYSAGQVIGIEEQALNSAICAFSVVRVGNAAQKVDFGAEDLVSVVFTTRDLLDSGDWLVVGNETPIPASDFFDLGNLQDSGFVGVKVIGSGIMIKMMEACFGLYPWDGFYEPDYLDKLLISKEVKPTGIVYKS